MRRPLRRIAPDRQRAGHRLRDEMIAEAGLILQRCLCARGSCCPLCRDLGVLIHGISQQRHRRRNGAEKLVSLVTNIRLPAAAAQAAWNGSKFRPSIAPPQFALNDAQSAQKAAPLDRHERPQSRGHLLNNRVERRRDDAVATRSVRGTRMRAILAFAILLLGLSTARRRSRNIPRSFADYFHGRGRQRISVAG